ncbi:MAG: DUF4390 domain-containing protein [Casimicrobiaceae bacterium]
MLPSLPPVTAGSYPFRPLGGTPARVWLRPWRALLYGLALLLAVPAWADVIAVQSAEIRVEEDGYYLNAEFDFTINATLEEALQKGVPLYFILEVEITRPRWYWFDDKLLGYSTQYRISYTPLTRQYRVAIGLLVLNFDSIEEVQRLISRVTSRRIAARDQLPRGTRLEAGVRLRLDVNQLPKPFQVNALASREWTLQSDWYRWTFAT